MSLFGIIITITMKLNNSSAYSTLRSKGLNASPGAELCANFAYRACPRGRQAQSVVRQFCLLASFKSQKGSGNFSFSSVI